MLGTRRAWPMRPSRTSSAAADDSHHGLRAADFICRGQVGSLVYAQSLQRDQEPAGSDLPKSSSLDCKE